MFGIFLTKVFGIFLPKYGYKVFFFLNFWYSVYRRNIGFFSFLKCLILSVCVTLKKMMKELQFLRDLIRMRVHGASGHEWWF